jgi:NAD(P)-dependent dehydrogenase (short-subunit alcohol dehydrogenase family)
MSDLRGQVAIVTGSTSGIGQAMAKALAQQGCNVVINGLGDPHAIETERCEIANAFGVDIKYHGADMTRPDEIADMVAFAKREFGRLDILLNNAGMNIADRHWDKLTPENASLMINGNLAAAAQCVAVALPIMRPQADGLIIHTASIAGRFFARFPGPLYTAAKHGLVAMSHTINMQECIHGIRSCVFLPGEVATAILDKRPNPVSAEEKARMVQPEDCADLILYVCGLPRRLVMNEVMLSPTWNRTYVAEIERMSHL